MKVRVLLCAAVLLACGAASAEVPQADGQNRKTIAEERQMAPRTPALAGLKRAAENGDADAQVEYARKLHRQFNDPVEGFCWLERAAAQNHPEGLYILSLYYLNGWGVVKNPEVAFKIMQASADTGYMNGEGVQHDFLTALRWFQKAAEQHHPDAMFYLGAAVYEGSGTDKNPAQGWAMIQEALRLGSSLAQHHIRIYADPAVTQS